MSCWGQNKRGAPKKRKTKRKSLLLFISRQRKIGQSVHSVHSGLFMANVILRLLEMLFLILRILATIRNIASYSSFSSCGTIPTILTRDFNLKPMNILVLLLTVSLCESTPSSHLRNIDNSCLTVVSITLEDIEEADIGMPDSN